MRERALLGLALAMLLVSPIGGATIAAEAPGLVLVGSNGATTSLTLAEIASLPAVTREISFEGEHGAVTTRFSGPPLWTLLVRARIVPGDPRSHVRMTVTTTGADGYTAVLALAEIDPAFEGKEVLLATEQDGKPVTGTGLRQAVPGDKRGGRSVRDVVRIAVGG